jgi:hypothetical protein
MHDLACVAFHSDAKTASTLGKRQFVCRTKLATINRVGVLAVNRTHNKRLHAIGSFVAEA